MTNQGGGVRNLSSGGSSDDGLGTFSPDGSTVAFVSNRGGSWAMWAVPTSGGQPTKLFNLPGPLTGNFWEEERVSWGK
jgi:Tol biopolymer transport system component